MILLGESEHDNLHVAVFGLQGDASRPAGRLTEKAYALTAVPEHLSFLSLEFRSQPSSVPGIDLREGIAGAELAHQDVSRSFIVEYP